MNKPHRWQSDPDPLSGQEGASLAGVRRDLAKVPLLRLLFTTLFVILAILLARYSWQLPFTDKDGRPIHIPIVIDAERALYDVRALVADLRHPVAQDPRVLLITYTQDTLAATGKRSPVDRAILARALTNLDRMGAKDIGIDILIDQAARRSSVDRRAEGDEDAGLARLRHQYLQRRRCHGVAAGIHGSLRAGPRRIQCQESQRPVGSRSR